MHACVHSPITTHEGQRMTLGSWFFFFPSTMSICGIQLCSSGLATSTIIPSVISPIPGFYFLFLIILFDGMQHSCTICRKILYCSSWNCLFFSYCKCVVYRSASICCVFCFILYLYQMKDEEIVFLVTEWWIYEEVSIYSQLETAF